MARRDDRARRGHEVAGRARAAQAARRAAARGAGQGRASRRRACRRTSQVLGAAGPAKIGGIVQERAEDDAAPVVPRGPRGQAAPRGDRAEGAMQPDAPAAHAGAAARRRKPEAKPAATTIEIGLARRASSSDTRRRASAIPLSTRGAAVRDELEHLDRARRSSLASPTSIRHSVAVARARDAAALHGVADDHALGAELGERAVELRRSRPCPACRRRASTPGCRRVGSARRRRVRRLAVEPAARRQVASSTCVDPVGEHAGVREHGVADDRDHVVLREPLGPRAARTERRARDRRRSRACRPA